MVGLGAGSVREDALEREMLRLGVKQEDIIENFIRSSGPGGQNVNKTSTCVYLKHKPTGIEVKCQKERSQALNRYSARKLLLEKIESLNLRRESEERKRLEKLRRKLRRRPRHLQLRILEEKRRHGQKKQLRFKVSDVEQ